MTETANKKITQKWWFWVLLIFTLGFIFTIGGCTLLLAMGSKALDNVNTNTSVAKPQDEKVDDNDVGEPKPVVEDKKPDEPALASRSFDDYSNYCDINATSLQKEDKFNTDYKNKYVEWSGEVVSVSEGLFGGYTISIKHCPNTFTSDVLVEMKDSEKDKLLKLIQGDQVTYRAKMSSYGDILGLSASDGELIAP